MTEKEKATEVDFEELVRAAQEDRERFKDSGNQEKTPKLGPEDIGKLVTVKKSYRKKSDFYQPAIPSTGDGPGTPAKGNPFYHFAVLTLEDGSERMKSLNGWDMEVIASGARTFKVGTQEYKGAFKLVLKPAGEVPPSPPAQAPKAAEGYI